MTGRRELGYYLTPIRDKNRLSGTDPSEVFAQAVLQFPDANGLHGPNVASCSYIVNSDSAAKARLRRSCTHAKVVRHYAGAVSYHR